MTSDATHVLAITEFDTFTKVRGNICIEHLQWILNADRENLLLWTHGSVQFLACLYSIVETKVVFLDFYFEHPSVFLFYFVQPKTRRFGIVLAVKRINKWHKSEKRSTKGCSKFG